MGSGAICWTREYQEKDKDYTNEALTLIALTRSCFRVSLSGLGYI